MRSIVYEILQEDLDARRPGSTGTSSYRSGSVRVFPRSRSRLLVVSPALVGIDQSALDAGISAELGNQDFAVLKVNRSKKTIGYVAHRLKVALQADAIVLDNQRISFGSAVPLAFYLPLVFGSWAIYETLQTVTLRYSATGFITWPVRTKAEVNAMISAIDKLMLERPSQILHIGPAIEHTQQIAKLISRPVVSEALLKSADFSLDLLAEKSWLGIVNRGWLSRAWFRPFDMHGASRFAISGLGVSLIIFLIALLAYSMSEFNQHTESTSQVPRISAKARESGSPYWELANAMGDEIRRTGIHQIQELQIRVDEVKSSRELRASIKWLVSASPLLRSVDQKAQGLAQTQLQQALSKMSGVESVDIDLAKNLLVAKLRPVPIIDDGAVPDLGQWMGALKKAHAVQIEAKNLSGARLSYRAPEQPIGNLVSFATSISRHAGVRELTLRAGSPGLGSFEFEMEPGR